ncbi:DUF1161 domain-containing protein [Xenorhabdus anantnagensis]|uniref:DUF1161 domain-containing protein n=1 Tax=Xenorhabdus anantnagensis TaxID=3025875 RepID=A0ABT5LPD2_9GAMM|nr:DUF1161 domain-containing protein [Xenorhabdus anantnagensis]MDC9596274.1 DUF1161 domain-containing protein [Xenorhabdus anantnagensis]
MVKKILLTGALFFAFSSFAVHAEQTSQKVTCESLKEEIAQKIIKNGVSETDFRLDLVPSDQVNEDNTTNGKIVGHCDQGKKKIVYIRFSHTNMTPDKAPSDKKSQE